MKTRLLIIIGFAAITSTNIVYGLWIPQSPEELFEQSETVFVGTVTSVTVLEFERSNTFHIEENGVTRIEIENYTQTLDEYTVDIEEFLKNPQTSNTITMLEATVGGVPGRSVSIGGFELDDHVLFYVPKIDGINQYSPESFEIPKYCDAKSVLEQSRVFLFNDFKIMQDGIEKNDNFTANKPIEFVYNKDMNTLEGESFDVDIKISKITGDDWETAIQENIHTESKPCEWVSTASWEFVPTAGRYYMWMNVSEGNHMGVETTSRKFNVIEEISSQTKDVFPYHGYHDGKMSPLKQFNAGARIDKIQCNESLQTILKIDGTPACVKPDSIEKLREYGWTNSKILSDELVREKILQLTGLLESGNVAEFNKLRTELVAFILLERVDASGMNLDGINLKYTSLPGANLHNATLKGADIGNAVLSNANLQGSDLKGADLSYAKLWGANLHGANLQDSNLEGASFRSADLTLANLQNANLENADIPITTNLSATDLRNVKNIPISVEEARERGAIAD